MDDNYGEWVECMGVASGCGEQEVGVASGSGWNLWVWLLGVVVRRYIDFLILLTPTPLVSVLFCSNIPTFGSLKKNYFVRRKKKNAKSRFFTSRGAYINLRYIAMLYTHLIGNQPYLHVHLRLHMRIAEY